MEAELVEVMSTGAVAGDVPFKGNAVSVDLMQGDQVLARVPMEFAASSGDGSSGGVHRGKLLLPAEYGVYKLRLVQEAPGVTHVELGDVIAVRPPGNSRGQRWWLLGGDNNVQAAVTVAVFSSLFAVLRVLLRPLQVKTGKDKIL